MPNVRYPLPAAFAAAWAFILVLHTGCASDFHAYRARVEPDGSLKMLDSESAKLPYFAKSEIGVYWRDHGHRQTLRPLPDKPYVVIGRAEGLAGYVWQTDAQIEDNFRRAAAALGGDAVINARRGPWLSAKAANEYYGLIVKWKSPSGAPAGSSDTPAR